MRVLGNTGISQDVFILPCGDFEWEEGQNIECTIDCGHRGMLGINLELLD